MIQVREGYEALRKRRLDEFMAGFNCISLKLKEMYQMITLGGDAELELVDSLDPFSEVENLHSDSLSTRFLSYESHSVAERCIRRDTKPSCDWKLEHGRQPACAPV